MKFKTKLTSSTHFFMIAFSVVIFAIMSTLVVLGVNEYYSMEETVDIIHTDFKEPIHQNPEADRLLAHLNNHLQSSYRFLMVIAIAVAILILILAGILIYLRKSNLLKSNEQHLEELLYYDQLHKLYTASTDEQLADPIIKMQRDRDAFFTAIKKGFENNEFVLFYQPIVNAENETIADAEALIRWKHPKYGILPPAVFLPLCENTGFIVQLGEWALQEACKQIKKWHELGYTQLCMSVNLSTRQLNHAHLLQTITNTLKDNQLSPHFLKLEITEDSLIKNVEDSIQLLRSLRQIGLQLSLDDFGTGYSYLKYLKQLPINHLKIDRSFIHDMTSNITSLGIVESVITLAKSLGLTITAEGVENKNQLHLLNKMKCDLIQGYLYSKPISADEFTQLLVSSNQHTKNTLGAHSPYQFTILNQTHLDQVVNLIATTFTEHEPMTKYLKITKSEFMPFAKQLTEKAIYDGLSVVALDHGKVIACSIVEDIADPLKIDTSIDPKFNIVFSLLEHLGRDFFNERLLDKGHICHLFITAVDPQYRGQGLSKKINFESIHLAQEKGFDFMCCEFTHAYNEQGVVKNLKNSRLLIRTCVYQDFIFEGKKPFEHLEGSASAYIWELREGAKLRYKINTPLSS